MRGNNMKTKIRKVHEDLRPQYDFDYTRSVRGKYFKRLLEEGANVVVLEPDVAEVFNDSASVNKALRSLIELARTTKLTPRKRTTGRHPASSRGKR
jgi:hypothetical protein